MSRVYFVSDTAQVELRSGRVEAPAADLLLRNHEVDVPLPTAPTRRRRGTRRGKPRGGERHIWRAVMMTPHLDTGATRAVPRGSGPSA